MKILLISSLIATTALAGCMDMGAKRSTSAAQAVDPLYTSLAGHTFSRSDFTITFKADGSMVGANPALTGSWEVRDGQFCRTIVTPARLAGSECQKVTISGDTYTFDGSSGVREYTLVK